MGEFYTSEKEKKGSSNKGIEKIKDKSKNNKHKNTKESFSSKVLRENFGALGDIRDAFEEIVSAVVAIGKFFIGLGDFFLWAGDFIKFLIVDVLNPVNLWNDITDLSIPKTIVSIIVQTIIKMFRYLVDELLNPVVKKIFGWDARSEEPEGEDQKTKKCFKQGDIKNVPLNVLIATIILPPLGVFMKFGLVSWVNILITGSLTMLFYVPGLIYALVLLYT